MTAPIDPNQTEHSQVTLDLAKKESAEHMEGMREAREEIASRKIVIKAYSLADPKAPEHAKTMHFIRHGQGFHNLMADLTASLGIEWKQFTHDPHNPYIKPELLDAPLTEKGRKQAELLQSKIDDLDNSPELIAFSPNCRALQTGCIAFQALANKIPFIAHEMAREENGIHLCDKRRPASQQAREFPQIDFGLLEELDPLFRDDTRESKMEVADRAYKFMEWISNRQEQYIGVVSHSGWLLSLFNAVFECDDELKIWFQTGEMRSVKVEFIHKP